MKILQGEVRCSFNNLVLLLVNINPKGENMNKNHLAGLTIGFVLLSMFGVAEASLITTNSAFTARLIGPYNVLAGSSSDQLDEGTAWNSSFLFVNEGTSDRVALEYFIGDLTMSKSVYLFFGTTNYDDPKFTNLSLYAYEANGLANASDYFNTDKYITTFTDFGAGNTSFSIDVTRIFNNFISNGNDYLGLLLKADDTNARYFIQSPNLVFASVPEPDTLLLFSIGLSGLAGFIIRRKKRA
jgi:hypothetical protein